MSKISIIVASSKNNVIGLNNAIPWDLPEDMKHFIQTTKNSVVIMGKNTFLSLNCKPLKNRINIVITTSDTEQFDKYDNLFFAKNINEAINLANAKNMQIYKNEQIFIIGGSIIYKQTLEENLIDNIYLTVVDTNLDGDAYFAIPKEKFILDKSYTRKFLKDKLNQYDLRFEKWNKIGI